jgi:hypothetical protein
VRSEHSYKFLKWTVITMTSTNKFVIIALKVELNKIFKLQIDAYDANSS